jgi:hypothetical protein
LRRYSASAVSEIDDWKTKGHHHTSTKYRGTDIYRHYRLLRYPLFYHGKSDFLTDIWRFFSSVFFFLFLFSITGEHFDTLVELHLQRVGLLALAGFTRYNGRSISASASLLTWINRQLFFFTTQSVVTILFILFILLYNLHLHLPPSQKSSWFRRLILSCFYHFRSRFPLGAASYYLFFYITRHGVNLSMLLRSISVVVDACVILSLVIPSRDSSISFSIRLFGFHFSFVNHLFPFP